jgi:hypothetical protein
MSSAAVATARARRFCSARRLARSFSKAVTSFAPAESGFASTGTATTH